MLCIILFNIGGQLAFHQYLVYKSDKFFNEQISKNLYSTDDLTEVKIPVNMPGISDWKSFENLSGEVRFENASYNYVKIKITHTAIYLMCIPNYETTRLHGQNIIYAKQIKDIPVPKKEHVPFGKMSLIAYNYPVIHFKFSIPVTISRKNTPNNHSFTLKSLISGPGQPPDMAIIVS